MAREESDREDLLREATALVERIELRHANSADDGENVFVGFRVCGAASIFFGADPAYHFNSRGKLRRAFQDGLLYKSEQMRLIELKRVRMSDAVELQRRRLSDDEQSRFLTDVRDRLATFREQLRGGEYRAVGQVPRDVDVLDRIRRWLDVHRDPIVARSPHAR